MQIDELYRIYLSHPVIETDTRKISKDCIFFALKGPHFNGNHFVQQALDKGASYCIADEDTGVNDERIILVHNALETLQQLARRHRQSFSIPFIAITGSNGKTTTKELVSAVLSSTFCCYTTQGNLNNHIGVPLTLLSIKKDAEIAVIEMGANHLHEIESYCQYAMPTHGLITNCGKAHLEGFGSEENIKKAKGELFNYLRVHGGTAFILTHTGYLDAMSKGIKQIITYGSADADYMAEPAEMDSSYLKLNITKGLSQPTLQTQLVGSYNLPNVLAALCIGKTFSVPDEKIKASIENYSPSNSRSQLIEKNGNKIILDAYNANPSSMTLAIENFAGLRGNKVLIIGSMMELGQAADEEHERIVDLITTFSWKAVVLTGNGFKKIPAHFLHFNNVEETAEWYKKQQFKDCLILIKGSRSMQMEKLLD